MVCSYELSADTSDERFSPKFDSSEPVSVSERRIMDKTTLLSISARDLAASSVVAVMSVWCCYCLQLCHTIFRFGKCEAPLPADSGITSLP